MKKYLQRTLLLLVFAIVLTIAVVNEGVPTGHWQEIEDFGKIVPQPGEYVVLASKKSLDDPAWRTAINDLCGRYKASLVEWENDVSETETQVTELAPRYIALVAKPEEIDRCLVAKMYGISRRIDPDFYGDAIFGILTARDALTFARLIEDQASPLLLERAIGTTNFDRERFRESFLITDWKAREFISSQDGTLGEKTDVPDGMDVATFFATNWERVHPQYVLTSSHATELNLEMPFGKGLLAPCDGRFYVFEEEQIPLFKKYARNTPALEKLVKESHLNTLSDESTPKIWIAAGNCLFGDVARRSDSMVPTAISAVNAKQIVGYTVPSWFGEGGWGTNSALFDGHGDMTVAQAWFFNNQRILSRLPKELQATDVPLEATGDEGTTAGKVAKIIFSLGANLTKENVGLLYDRDVVAFYGDPLFRVRFDETANNCQPWKCILEKRGSKRRLTISGTQDKTRKGKFDFWFPEVCDEKKLPKFTRVSEGNTEEFSPKYALTKNFIMIEDEIELAPSEKISIEYSVKTR